MEERKKKRIFQGVHDSTANSVFLFNIITVSFIHREKDKQGAILQTLQVRLEKMRLKIVH
jgi:hypothetical protein